MDVIQITRALKWPTSEQHYQTSSDPIDHFLQGVIHVFSPIYTHVLSRDGLGVKSPVKFFKMRKYRILEDIA
jgi:hypothetical protein